MSITSRISAATQKITRKLRAESVTVTDAAGVTTNLIDDDRKPEAVVSLDPISVGDFGSGPGRWQGHLRLPASRRALLLTCLTAVIRDQTWNIVGVGEVLGDSFRVELRRDEQNHTNLSDLEDNQAVWGPEE
jgi:hypothetical protein